MATRRKHQKQTGSARLYWRARNEWNWSRFGGFGMVAGVLCMLHVTPGIRA